MHASVCDMILDLTQNAIEADADKTTVTITTDDNTIAVVIKDNGKGMDNQTLHNALDPFFTDGQKHSRRRVGLGLPFLKQLTETTDGEFDILSEPGEGTTVTFKLNRDHIDTPPMGNIPVTVLSMMSFEGEYDLDFERSYKDREYRISRSELNEVLGGMETAADLKLAKAYLTGLEEDLDDIK